MALKAQQQQLEANLNQNNGSSNIDLTSLPNTPNNNIPKLHRSNYGYMRLQNKHLSLTGPQNAGLFFGNNLLDPECT